MKLKFFLPVVALGASLAPARAASLDQIETLVVIYAENRSFDNLFGLFPGARGIKDFNPETAPQRDRNGEILKTLPPVWKGVNAALPEGATTGLPNAPFAIDDPQKFNQPASVATRDLIHAFYQEQMQIDGGKNDKFVAWGDSGALVMGYYAQSQQKLAEIAARYTLADNFFHGAFGGSFLNHFMLVCACVPFYPDADKTAKNLISEVEADGVTLKLAPDTPATMEGPPKFLKSGALTPDFHAVNTMMPPYQPSAVPPAAGGDKALADPSYAIVLPPQRDINIGDLLTLRGVNWAWYAGAWAFTLENGGKKPVPNFQYHHQPFNYFANYAPGTPGRAHLRDGGLSGDAFIADIDAGKLPPVTFYKPQGNLNEHPGYSEVMAGDAHIADLIAHLEKSPQWAKMLVVVTFDENGGFWDHVAPPKADRWGPGVRIPAVIVSPFAKKGFVDHTLYDTTSILRLITRRWNLPVLPGLIARDRALAAHGEPPLGDFSAALEP